MSFLVRALHAVVLASGWLLLATAGHGDETPDVVSVESEDAGPGASVQARSAVAPAIGVHHGRVPLLEDLPATDEAADAELSRLAAWNRAGGQPTRGGFGRRLRRARTVRLRGRSLQRVRTSHAHLSAMLFGDDPDTLVWTASVRVRDAAGLKLALRDPALPAGSVLWTYGADRIPQGPVAIPDAATQVWAPSVMGDRIWLEVHLPRVGLAPDAAYGFTIDEVVQLVALDDDGTPIRAGQGLAPRSTACLLDAACATLPAALGDTVRGIGRMVYASGGSLYLCSGGLLNDKNASTFEPYFLTAHHCLSTASEAASLEVWWDYRRTSCGGPDPHPSTLPKSFGATLLATSLQTDFTLLRLTSIPGGRNLLGWTTAAPSGVLMRLHHPAGNPLHYSTHTSCPTCPACSERPQTDYLYSLDTLGGNTGGSSGSVVLHDATSPHVVGQLLGACGPNPDDDCDRRNASVDGRFARTFPAIDEWINVEVPSSTTTTTSAPGTTSTTLPPTTTTTLPPSPCGTCPPGFPHCGPDRRCWRLPCDTLCGDDNCCGGDHPECGRDQFCYVPFGCSPHAVFPLDIACAACGGQRLPRPVVRLFSEAAGKASRGRPAAARRRLNKASTKLRRASANGRITRYCYEAAQRALDLAWARVTP